MRQFSSTKATATGLVLTLALSLAAMPAGAVADGLSFIVFGDAPYGDAQSVLLERDVAPAIEKAQPPFVIHLGDFLDTENESCAETLFRQRYKQLMDLHQDWVFYTPGDNDWTDCDHSEMKDGLNPVSEVYQLKILRGLIRDKRMKHMLVKKWQYETQQASGFPENARWTQGGVMFATLHIVGTNNGRRHIYIVDEEATLDLVDARDRANSIWLDAAFGAALRSEARAVVIAIQADVTDAKKKPCFVPDYTVSERDKRARRSKRRYCDGFAAFRHQLRKLAAKFGKPVLLIHGDTDPFCLDEQFGGAEAPNLRRLNAFGDRGEVDATVITVNLDDPGPPFEIRRLMRPDKSPDGKCS